MYLLHSNPNVVPWGNYANQCTYLWKIILQTHYANYIKNEKVGVKIYLLK